MTLALASGLGPLLRRLDPERAHRVALIALRLGLAGADPAPDDPLLSVQALGLHFPNPIGLAAGFDKDAAAIAPLLALGFGFVEAGTVTPRPQVGNPRPRIFRLVEDEAVINSLGFNNAGIEAFVARLRRLHRGPKPVGVNVGINKTGADPERDYPALTAAVAPYADYVVLNVSSPNTPGLRDLQSEARLRAILDAIAAKVPNRPPLVVKVAPDLDDDALVSVVETAIAAGAAGLIVSNTTVSRPATLRRPAARKAGGLSGAPLFPLSTAVLARAALIARGRLVLIGVGGIRSGRDILTKLKAGASLVQLYTAFAYHGPALLPRLKRELLALLQAEGYTTIRQAIGTDAERLAGAPSFAGTA